MEAYAFDSSRRGSGPASTAHPSRDGALQELGDALVALDA
eukprot:COSAG02_NODE_48040_length_336_cov_1.721519_1_plen_39_part_10